MVIRHFAPFSSFFSWPTTVSCSLHVTPTWDGGHHGIVSMPRHCFMEIAERISEVSHPEFAARDFVSFFDPEMFVYDLRPP